MASWYTDEGLDRLITEWKGKHPNATVYRIADSKHSQDPDVSQHAPDDGGSAPGDDKGEVDGADFMPGKGVSDAQLDELAEGLRKSRDPRLLYVIRRQRIFSSTVQPWVWRPYKGNYHGHTHVSVNDKFDRNTADWKWEPVAGRVPNKLTGEVSWPEYIVGDDDDIIGGYNDIVRIQVMANLLDGTLPDLTADGVYGKLTAQKVGRAIKGSGPVNKMTLPVYKVLFGAS